MNVPLPYKFYSLQHSNDHNTDLLINAACEVLRALQIISRQLDKLSEKPNKANTPAPKCLLCNDTGQHLVDCPLCDKSGG